MQPAGFLHICPAHHILLSLLSMINNFINSSSGLLPTYTTCNMPAALCFMLQAPVSNREYQFSFAASFGDDLLRQVQAVTVRVTLLRCTWGQYMTVSSSKLYVSTYTQPTTPCM
jgi:hypothetical protein